MAKQFISEAKRMQKLAGLQELKVHSWLEGKVDEEAIKAKINEVDKMLIDVMKVLLKPPFVVDDYSASIEVNDLINAVIEAQKIINKQIREEMLPEMALPEFARTAGTGGAYTITEKGEEVLRQAKATGKAPEGIKNSEIAALVFLFKAKKEGKRVQKMDYAKEKGVDQPAVNSTFNGLEVKELATKEGYTSKQQEPKTSRPRTDISAALSDLDIEESKKTLSEAKAGLFGKYIEFEKPEGPEVIVSFEKPNEEELGLDFGTLDEIMEIKEIDGLKLYFVYV